MKSLIKSIINVNIFRLQIRGFCISSLFAGRPDSPAALTIDTVSPCGEEMVIQEPASQADEKQDELSQESARQPRDIDSKGPNSFPLNHRC